MACSSPGSSVHGILQARTLEWVAIPFSRGSSRPMDRTSVSCTASRFFTLWVTREAHWGQGSIVETTSEFWPNVLTVPGSPALWHLTRGESHRVTPLMWRQELGPHRGTALISLTVKQDRQKRWGVLIRKGEAKLLALSSLLSNSVTASLPTLGVPPLSPGWAQQQRVSSAPVKVTRATGCFTASHQLAEPLPLRLVQAGLHGHLSHLGSSVQMNSKMLPSFTVISEIYLSPRGKHKPFCYRFLLPL